MKSNCLQFIVHRSAFIVSLMFLRQATPIPTPTPSLTSIAAELHQGLRVAVPLVFEGVLVLLAFWLVAAIGRRLIAYTAPRVRADTSVVLLLSRLYYYGVLVFGAITALGTAGLDVRALVAGLGLTGFALGFALKDVLSNFVSGVMLLAYRPFRIGDVIEMGEFTGTIESIRIRDTLIRAADGRLIIIPNTKLITEVVVNHSDVQRATHAATTIHSTPHDAPTTNAPTTHEATATHAATTHAPPLTLSNTPPVAVPPAARRRAPTRPKDEEDDGDSMTPPASFGADS
jgi:small-conductance mechanosensitive channel